MKILVTDADCQLGKELRQVLESHIPGITTYIDRESLDVTDAEALRRYLQSGMFTHVVNTASYSKVDLAEEESGACAALNTGTVSTLANFADEYGYKVIQISTNFVFDGTSCRPYTESDKVNPTTHFGTTKRKAETSLMALAPESIIIRTSWLFSPYGDNFVTRTLRRLQSERAINVVADQIGSPTYAYDLAMAILRVLTARQWVPGIFNFANEGAASRFDFAKAIQRISGLRACRINPIGAIDYPTVAPRPYYSILNKQRIKATYDIEIPHWEESLAHCLRRL